MSGQDDLCFSPRGPQGVGGEARLTPIRAREDEFAVHDVHAMEFLRIIETEETALHFVRGRVFAHHKGEMPPGTLDASGGVQFGEKANEHAVKSAKPCGRNARTD